MKQKYKNHTSTEQIEEDSDLSQDIEDEEKI